MIMDHSKVGQYRTTIGGLVARNSDFPRTISIETQVKCNAKCSFCPYPTSPRKGEEIDTPLFYKIIDDLSEMPPDHVISFTLARINEPLLDKRLQVFSDYVAERLPGARQAFWSNGTMLNPGTFEWIDGYGHSRLNISLNSVTEQGHQDMMGFGLTKVLRNLDHLHQLKAKKDWRGFVNMHAPYLSPETTREMEAFCAERYPLFNLAIRPFFSWEGDEKSGTKEKEQSGVFSTQDFGIGSLPCGQWFDLHILANGFATKCCIDQTGFSDGKYDTRKHHALDIYRQSLPGRETVTGCGNCTHLG